MQIEQIEIKRVKPYERNPRENDGAVEAVARSLQEYGFRQPIVVDQNFVIVVGHTRYKAAKLLGYERVPVHVAADLSEDQARGYRIADNQTASISDWNSELLAEELMGLLESNFQLENTGFTPAELDLLLPSEPERGRPLTGQAAGANSTAGSETSEQKTPESAPEDTRPQLRTSTGDCWQVGPVRLVCGQSGNAQHVKKLLGDLKLKQIIDLFTDKQSAAETATAGNLPAYILESDPLKCDRILEAIERQTGKQAVKIED